MENRYLEALKQRTTLNTASGLVVLGLRQATSLDPVWIVFTLLAFAISLSFALHGIYVAATRDPVEVNETVLALSVAFFAFGLVLSFIFFIGLAMLQSMQSGGHTG